MTPLHDYYYYSDIISNIIRNCERRKLVRIALSVILTCADWNISKAVLDERQGLSHELTCFQIWSALGWLIRVANYNDLMMIERGFVLYGGYVYE